jgi:hypothetical protein
MGRAARLILQGGVFAVFPLAFLWMFHTTHHPQKTSDQFGEKGLRTNKKLGKHDLLSLGCTHTMSSLSIHVRTQYQTRDSPERNNMENKLMNSNLI